MAETEVGTVGNGRGGASLRYLAFVASSLAGGLVALRLPFFFSLSETTSGALVVSGLCIAVVISVAGRAEGIGPREEPGSPSDAKVAVLAFFPAQSFAAVWAAFLLLERGITTFVRRTE